MALAFPPGAHHYSDRSRHRPSPLARPDRHAKGRVVVRVLTYQRKSWRPARQGSELKQEAHRLVRRAVPVPMLPAPTQMFPVPLQMWALGVIVSKAAWRFTSSKLEASSNLWALLRMDRRHGFFQRRPRIARVSGVSCRMGETGFAVRACPSASGRMVSYRNWCSPKPLGSDGGLLKT